MHWVPEAMYDLSWEGCMGVVRLDQQISLKSNQRVGAFAREELERKLGNPNFRCSYEGYSSVGRCSKISRCYKVIRKAC